MPNILRRPISLAAGMVSSVPIRPPRLKTSVAMLFQLSHQRQRRRAIEPLRRRSRAREPDRDGLDERVDAPPGDEGDDRHREAAQRQRGGIRARTARAMRGCAVLVSRGLLPALRLLDEDAHDERDPRRDQPAQEHEPPRRLRRTLQQIAGDLEVDERAPGTGPSAPTCRAARPPRRAVSRARPRRPSPRPPPTRRRCPGWRRRETRSASRCSGAARRPPCPARTAASSASACACGRCDRRRGRTGCRPPPSRCSRIDVRIPRPLEGGGLGGGRADGQAEQRRHGSWARRS